MDFADVSAGVTELAAAWAADRPSRQMRRSLDPADFDALRRIGFMQLCVPVGMGGAWTDMRTDGRAMGEILRTLAHGDPSVALVASMHPTVVAFWLLNDVLDTPWQAQRRDVLESAMQGRQWGTITSEPGSGGDIMRTRTVAEPAPGGEARIAGDAYRLSGDKHFGSGSGITSFMLTTGLPVGGDEPAMFVLDVADRPWERDDGMTLTAEWDGVGMAATQSHGMRLTDMPATRVAWDRPFAELTRDVAPFIAAMFTAVVMGVLDAAMGTAQPQIASRVDTLRAYETTEWTRADSEYWLAVQAYEGALRGLESGDPAVALHAALRAKQTIADLAETVLLRLTRVLGGGTFSQRSPFSHWFEDVRALGFLRPPWGLAHDGLFATSLPVDRAQASANPL